MPLFEVTEERIYYVRAKSKSNAEDIYGNAHPTDAASAQITRVRRITSADVGNGDSILSDDYS